MAQKFQMTKEGYDALVKRLNELKVEELENSVAIQDARSQGDLSENADYQAARERQKQIFAEKEDLERKIANAEIIETEKIVKVKFLDDGFIAEYKLVGSVEADPIHGKISIDSPLGKAIESAKEGDQVMVRTETGERFDVEVIKVGSNK